MADAKHQGYTLAEIFHRLFMNMDMRTCDGKTVDAYLKELGEVAHASSKDGDDAMAFTSMLDSLGSLTDKNNVKKNNRG